MAYLIYSVVRSRSGWAVNNGADTLADFPTRQHAREDAIRRANRDLDRGIAASFEDLEDREG